jgi:Zn-dependent protease with chaperone function
VILVQVVTGLGVAWLLAFIANHFALRAWRQSEGLHWTERARLLYPARASAATNIITIPLLLFFLGGILLSANPSYALILPAILGSFLGNYALDREICPRLNLRRWISQMMMALVFHTSFWIGPLIVAPLLPPEFGITSLLLLVGILGLGVFSATDSWIPLLRWLGMLKSAPARIDDIVRGVAAERRVLVKNVWVLDVPIGNAFASIFRREVGFTSRFLDLHPDPEIAAVVAHELGHLTESRWALAGRFVAHFVMYPLIFIGPASRSFGLVGVLAAILTSIALLWFRQRLLRRLEARADAHAVGGSEDGTIYAQALSRLYETNQLPAVMPKRARMPHPDLYDRMLAAGVTPDFPRPKPPAARAWTGRLLTGIFVVALAARIITDAKTATAASESEQDTLPPVSSRG